MVDKVRGGIAHSLQVKAISQAEKYFVFLWKKKIF